MSQAKRESPAHLTIPSHLHSLRVCLFICTGCRLPTRITSFSLPVSHARISLLLVLSLASDNALLHGSSDLAGAASWGVARSTRKRCASVTARWIHRPSAMASDPHAVLHGRRIHPPCATVLDPHAVLHSRQIHPPSAAMPDLRRPHSFPSSLTTAATSVPLQLDQNVSDNGLLWPIRIEPSIQFFFFFFFKYSMNMYPQNIR
jgi:hypothetical protein